MVDEDEDGPELRQHVHSPAATQRRKRAAHENIHSQRWKSGDLGQEAMRGWETVGKELIHDAHFVPTSEDRRSLGWGRET